MLSKYNSLCPEAKEQVVSIKSSKSRVLKKVFKNGLF